MKRRLVLHPFLFASYPIIALYSYNIDQVFLAEIWRAYIWSIIAATILFIIIKLLTKDWERAGLLCSLSFVLFFSYGHVYSLMMEKNPSGSVLGRSDYLAALWATIFILSSWFIIRKLRKTGKVTEFLNLISIIAICLPGYQILNFHIQNLNNKSISFQSQNADIVTPKLPDLDSSPDVYYIVVDGYGRADVLVDLYRYDNSRFIKYLEDRDFCIDESSYSNYAQTALSLASSLNFDYVQNLTDLRSIDTTDRSPLAKLVKQNKVRSFLSDHGYQIIAFESGYSVTEWKDTDIYLTSSTTLNSFETMVISSSAAVLILDRFIPSWYRNSILSILDQLGSVGYFESPKFVFAHLTIPHPPFVFGPNGELRPSMGFKEGNYFGGTAEEYIEGYRGQITYLNNRLTEIIDEILENSQPKPIIILQSDHGPGAYLNWDSIENTCLRERMSIMNAYYLPGVECDQIEESNSPVNTFPFIFNTYFKTEIDLSSNHHYFSLWTSPYDLIDITDSIDTCNNPAVAK